jgi:glycogen debranching enzyme
MRADDFSPASRSLARSLVEPLLNSVAQERGFAVVHSIPEIFDATAPHRPDGCPAQAWSVAEVIRVLALSRSPVA